MTQRKSTADAPAWLGQEAEGRDAFGDGQIWIGQHEADRDILVFDPSEMDPAADVLTLYSLTQHRIRSFPRATVLERIHALTDEPGYTRAKEDYARRATLRSAREVDNATAQTERRSRQRDHVIAAHRRHIEALGLTYQGVRETAADHRPGRRTKCHSCGIALDDFAGAVCLVCNAVLCSCGTCACGSGSRSH